MQTKTQEMLQIQSLWSLSKYDLLAPNTQSEMVKHALENRIDKGYRGCVVVTNEKHNIWQALANM